METPLNDYKLLRFFIGNLIFAVTENILK